MAWRTNKKVFYCWNVVNLGLLHKKYSLLVAICRKKEGLYFLNAIYLLAFFPTIFNSSVWKWKLTKEKECHHMHSYLIPLLKRSERCRYWRLYMNMYLWSGGFVPSRKGCSMASFKSCVSLPSTSLHYFDSLKCTNI